MIKGMQVYLTEINDDIEEKDLEDLLKYIEKEYRAKILRYRFLSDRKRSLYGHLLSRYAIIRESGLKNEDIRILTTDHGKPYVKDREDICYNVSHSGDYVACVIGSGPVGIDIQEIKEVDIKIAERFFSEAENRILDLAADEDKTALFCDMWSLKEAYVKKEGKGLSIPLDSFSVLWEKDRYVLRIKGMENNEVRFGKYDIKEGYRLSVCSDEDPSGLQISEPDIGEIKQMLGSKLTVQ